MMEQLSLRYNEFTLAQGKQLYQYTLFVNNAQVRFDT